jgi:IS605 OrfB family transposase
MLHSVKIIAQLKLVPTPEQADALRRTLAAANHACNHISAVAWETRTFGKFSLQKLVYQDVRDTFHLGAQLAVRCIAKVADAYKLDRKLQRTFRPTAAVAYDDRILSWNLKGSEVSIWTLDGRLAIPFVCGERQQALLATRSGETDLCLVGRQFYLFATCNVDEPDPLDVDGALGVDLGIVNLATDSDGETFSGERIERRRQWYANRRQALQKVGTRSAKRRLRQLRGRQRRFQKDTNHVISKRLVAKAERTKRAIALEDLSGIRQRARVKRQQRARHSNWAFGQLRQFVSYKARLVGVRVCLVDPKYTSQQCSACTHTERRNRKSQAEFCCVVCGHAASADYNAAINIERAALSAGLWCTAPHVGVETQAQAL